MTSLPAVLRSGLARAVGIGVARAVLFTVPLGVAFAVIANLPMQVGPAPVPATRAEAWQRLCHAHHAQAKRAVIEQGGRQRLATFDRAWSIFRGELPGTFVGLCPRH